MSFTQMLLHVLYARFNFKSIISLDLTFALISIHLDENKMETKWSDKILEACFKFYSII